MFFDISGNFADTLYFTDRAEDSSGHCYPKFQPSDAFKSLARPFPSSMLAFNYNDSTENFTSNNPTNVSPVISDDDSSNEGDRMDQCVSLPSSGNNLTFTSSRDTHIYGDSNYGRQSRQSFYPGKIRYQEECITNMETGVREIHSAT
jgi:hypothetical protein